MVRFGGYEEAEMGEMRGEKREERGQRREERRQRTEGRGEKRRERKRQRNPVHFPAFKYESASEHLKNN